MRRFSIKAMLTAMALVLCQFTAHAEDIDLFVGATPSNSTDMPNVLFIIDNTANWNSAFTNEMAALKSVFDALPVNKFRIGIMLFTETGGGNSGNDGGYIRAAMRTMDATNKGKYSALVASIDQTADKSNGGKAALAMEEAYKYFSAGTPWAGNNKNKADYTGNTSGTVASNAVYALAANALGSKTGTTYTSPIVSGSCGKNYIIFVSNGAAQDNASDLSHTGSALTAAGGSISQITLNPSGSQDNYADEWARFMRTSSYGITTYTLDVNKVTTGQGPGWTALLKSMAGVSLGKYFDVASTGSQILDALNDILSEIQSVNSVFASVSLPVSVNTQGQYINQVYIGMFRPDQDGNPRWAGNLKQYKLGGVNIETQDADSKSAINTTTGFITECARSFWTPSTVDTEWTFRPQGGCLTVANSNASNYPDGNVVEKGAQAYKLRANTSRIVKTCSATMSSCQGSSALVDFSSANVTQAQLGAASTTERDNIISWAIGADNKDDENQDGSGTGRRLSIHGDVVHSRPVAVNFGTDASPVVGVFYGANDGMLRAVNGNRTAAIGSIPAGGEMWAFMPPEFYGSIKRLRDNTTRISFPGNSAGTPTPAAKNYGMDGPITAFKGTVGGSSKVILYGTMRRGGRSIYAFDVTATGTTPSTPTFKWRIGCPNAANDTGCTTDMSGVGQTWSSLKTMYATGYGSGTAPLMIMGGGYDTCEDTDSLTTGGANHACTSSTKGNKVYVLDADTGAVARAFDTDRAVVADSTLVVDTAGKIQYAYTADLGGNVYRMTFGTGGTATWTITKIASLGCDTVASCTAPRKFMFAPSVVTTDSNFYYVMLGSGDREKPLNYYASAASVTNYFFMIKDKPSDAAWSTDTANCISGTAFCKASLYGITDNTTPTAAQLATKKGWYLALHSTEQVVTTAVTLFGTVNFSTHQPAVAGANTCASNLGTTLLYKVNYLDAASANGTNNRYEDVAGDGLPPSPVAGQVTLDDGTTVPFCIGCSKDSALQGSKPGSLSSVIQPKNRLYWYIQK
ncbi:pilus assembly protein [Caenimonas aquaedulcis]|uniref:Pilus assembly protein PilY n=1 Tax=Caenimonas aquaedulcis TaxID=2793270 RepID=A0A931H2S1_9BURK|nr:PilC/PilY family type IV pilus protein [Caenimonas aquaedulcis]MBG9387506.1 pilus assembly protein PilY [Caenimonas aquaedulcis]